MSNLIFLVEGFDGATPIQAYCSVMTPRFIFIDTIYPYPNISIFIHENDHNTKFGDNTFTRRRVIDELVNLRRIVHAVKHFYHRYKAVMKTYSEIESLEYDRYNHLQFANMEERSEYNRRMHQRLKQIYIHYLQRAIPEIPVTEHSDLVIQPYLLQQIISTLAPDNP